MHQAIQKQNKTRKILAVKAFFETKALLLYLLYLPLNNHGKIAINNKLNKI